MAATTLRADLLIVSLTFHSRFLATKKRTAVETGRESAHVNRNCARREPLTSNETDNDNHDDDGDHATLGNGDGVARTIARSTCFSTSIDIRGTVVAIRLL